MTNKSRLVVGLFSLFFATCLIAFTVDQSWIYFSNGAIEYFNATIFDKMSTYNIGDLKSYYYLIVILVISFLSSLFFFISGFTYLFTKNFKTNNLFVFTLIFLVLGVFLSFSIVDINGSSSIILNYDTIGSVKNNIQNNLAIIFLGLNLIILFIFAISGINSFKSVASKNENKKVSTTADLSNNAIQNQQVAREEESIDILSRANRIRTMLDKKANEIIPGVDMQTIEEPTPQVIKPEENLIRVATTPVSELQKVNVNVVNDNMNQQPVVNNNANDKVVVPSKPKVSTRVVPEVDLYKKGILLPKRAKNSPQASEIAQKYEKSILQNVYSQRPTYDKPRDRSHVHLDDSYKGKVFVEDSDRLWSALKSTSRVIKEAPSQSINSDVIDSATKQIFKRSDNNLRENPSNLNLNSKSGEFTIKWDDD